MIKKYNQSLLFFLALGLFLIGCNKDNNDEEGLAKVIVSFDPRYEGMSLQIADQFTEVHGYPVFFSSMKFYLSNVELYSGSEVMKLSDIEIIDMDENRLVMDFEIPTGTYTGIRFDLGVPRNMNGIEEENPDFMSSIFAPDHPLNLNQGMYWGWNTGYRFFSLEGRCDTLDIGTDILPMQYAFHSGTDTLFRELPVFNYSFSARSNQTVVVPFEVDMKTIFASQTDTIDFKSELSFHGNYDQLPLGIKFANNTAASIKLIE